MKFKIEERKFSSQEHISLQRFFFFQSYDRDESFLKMYVSEKRYIEKKVRYVCLYLFKTTAKPTIKIKIKRQSEFKLIWGFKELKVKLFKELDKFRKISSTFDN